MSIDRDLPRAKRFLQKPLREKAKSISLRWRSLTSRMNALWGIFRPVRLTFGARWVRRTDHISKPVAAGTFEKGELAFVERFLRAGTTVLDIGAHYGLYTLLASKKVEPRGRVFAFEPSRRERRMLRLHLILNQCWNVRVQGLALGSQESQVELHVVDDWAGGCNSLRPPSVSAEAHKELVQVTRLDAWLARRKVTEVDFVKLDVEGAELDVLKGAEGMLTSELRPVILAEVQDIRTGPWGYRAKEIIDYLTERNYLWFQSSEFGALHELDLTRDEYDGNYIACPRERIGLLRG